MTQFMTNPNMTAAKAPHTTKIGTTDTSTGQTFSAAGMRWVYTGASACYFMAEATGANSGTVVASGIRITRHSGLANGLKLETRTFDMTGATNFTSNDIGDTSLPAGVAITLRNYSQQAWATGTQVYIRMTGPFDVTLTGFNVYDLASAPVGVVLEGNDCDYTYTQVANSLAATFTHANPNEQVNLLTWTWGDGTAAVTGGAHHVGPGGPAPGNVAQRVVSHTFPTRGRYTVSLKGDNRLNNATVSKVVTVPSGTFTADFSSQAEYLNVLVDGASSVAPTSDPVDTYEWNWGDGTPNSFGQQQSHTYTTAGGYPVSLTTKTTATLRTSTTTKTVTVTAPPNPSNYFTATRNLLAVTFSPSIAGATSYAWNFGDGTTAATQQPTHTYGEPGTYTVTLTVNGTQTTSQAVTVFDAYRPLTKLTDALRLEVAVPYPAGTIYNRLPNASGAQGAYGWATPVSGSYVIGSSTSDQTYDHGVPDAKLIYFSSGASTQQMLSQPVRVAAGQYASGQLVSPYIEGFLRMTVDALNASGTVLGSSVTSGYQAAGTAAVRTTPYLLPTGTTHARFRIEFFGTNTGTVPIAGAIMQVRNAMLATAATSAELTANPYVSGRSWVNVIGSSSEIGVNRPALDVGSLSAVVLDSAYDPATSATIRPGQPVRLRAYTEDGSGNVVWQPIFTGTLTGAEVTYNRQATDAKSTKVVLTATDATTLLTQKTQPNGVATLPELPSLLEIAGVPYEINGGSGQVPTASVVAVNPNASVLDQLVVTRDTTGSYAFVSRAGVLTALDSAHLSAAVSGVVDETTYSLPDASFDTEACINSVTIKWLRYTQATNTTEEITYGPYEDAASIEEWGYQPATYTMQGVENSTNIANKAAAILAANKTPVRRIRSASLPIRYIEDLSRSKALLDLYDLVQLAYARTGTNAPARVTGVSHSITAKRWTVGLDFGTPGQVAPPQEVPSPPLPTGGATPGGGTATSTTFTPAGTIAATNVQAALVEVDGDATALRTRATNLETRATNLEAAQPFASYWKNADQSVATGAWTDIPVQAALSPLAGGMAFNTTTGVATVPKAGRYLVAASVRWAGNATGARGCSIVKGTTNMARTSVPAAVAQDFTVTCTKVLVLVANDTIKMQGFQNSTVALVARTAEMSTFLDITYLGP